MLSVALEIVVCSPLLFLDERVPGLHVSSSIGLMQVLRHTSRAVGMTVILSMSGIAVPLLPLVDDLVGMGEGRVLYCGSGATVEQYLESVGYVRGAEELEDAVFVSRAADGLSSAQGHVFYDIGAGCIQPESWEKVEEATQADIAAVAKRLGCVHLKAKWQKAGQEQAIVDTMEESCDNRGTTRDACPYNEPLYASHAFSAAWMLAHRTWMVRKREMEQCTNSTILGYPVVRAADRYSNDVASSGDYGDYPATRRGVVLVSLTVLCIPGTRVARNCSSKW